MEDEIAVESESAPEEIIEEVTEEVAEEVTDEVTEEPESTYVETDNPNLTKRFGQLTAKAKQAEAKAQQLQARLDQIDADNLAAELARPAPTEEQFDYDQEAYGRAVASHFEAQGIAKGKQQAIHAQEQQNQAQAAQQVTQAYAQQVQDFAANTPDFSETIKNLNGLDINLQRYIQKQENAPQIAYAMGKNPELANRMHQAAINGNGVVLGGMLEQIKQNINSGPKNNKITKAGRPIKTPIQSGVIANDPNRKYQHSGGATFE